MATSGVVGTFNLPMIRFIEAVVKECRISTADITTEMMETVKDETNLFLSELQNPVFALWTIENVLIGSYKGRVSIAMPTGTIDVTQVTMKRFTWPSGGSPSSSPGGVAANAFDQDLSTVCDVGGAGGIISYDFGTDVKVTTVGLYPETGGSWNLVWEISDDGVSWTQVLDSGVQTYVSQWYYYDLEFPKTARYFRARMAGSGTLAVKQMAFCRNPYEVPCARLNRDDYSAMPNKSFEGQPLQFFVGREREGPRLYFWPTSDSDFYAFSIWRRRKIQDVTDFVQTLDLPQRWISCVKYNVAYRCGIKWPQVPPPHLQLVGQMAAVTMKSAMAEERDNSPIVVMPNIGVYTR